MGQIQKSHTQVGKPTSTHTGWKTAHEASDFLDRIWEPRHVPSYTEMNNVTVQELKQTGALPVTDMKNTSALLGQHRTQSTALWSHSAIQERDGLAEGSTENQEDGQR